MCLADSLLRRTDHVYVITKSTLRKTASSRTISGISTICVANISRYLSSPNLARGNDCSLGYSRACRIEAAAAAPNVHRRHLIRRELRLSSSPASKEAKNIVFSHGFHREFRMLWGMCSRGSTGGSSRSSRSIDLNRESYSGGPTTGTAS